MCGFGDSWTKDAAQDQPGAFPYDQTTEFVDRGEALILMVKNPELGKAKTRLASTMGDEAALKWYRYLLNHTRETTQLVPATRYLYYSSFIDEEDEWSPESFVKSLQPEGDLGQRMQKAFAQTFAKGHSRVLIIGSDCLDLRVHHLKDAYQALQKHDFVIGPASDGGYYLLGMNSLENSLFENKAWSTEGLFAETLANIKALNKTVALLPELSDVDFEDDLHQSLQRLEKDQNQSPDSSDH